MIIRVWNKMTFFLEYRYIIPKMAYFEIFHMGVTDVL